MTAPEGVKDRDFHETTWALMSLLTALVTFGGWLSTGDLARQHEVGPDTARRMLRTLEAGGWVRRMEAQGTEFWTIGPELPRIGLQFQELLVRRSASLKADFDRLSVPFKGGA